MTTHGCFAHPRWRCHRLRNIAAELLCMLSLLLPLLLLLLLLLPLGLQVVGERYPDMKKFSYHYNKPLSAAEL